MANMEIEWLDGLETRVREAVDRLAALSEENRSLREKVQDLETRLAAESGQGEASGLWEREREEVRRRVEALTQRLEELATL